MIIEKTIQFEVASTDLDDVYTWHQASEQGKDGWRLPSKEELNLMYEQRETIGGFASAWYWSSSETSTTNAWIQNFTNGNQSNYYKNLYGYRVRLVRDKCDIPQEATE